MYILIAAFRSNYTPVEKYSADDLSKSKFNFMEWLLSLYYLKTLITWLVQYEFYYRKKYIYYVLFSSFFPSHSQWKPFEFTPLFTTTRKKRICGCIFFKLCFYTFNLFLITLFSEFQNYEWDFMLSFERDILMKVNWVTFLKSKNRTLQFYSFLLLFLSFLVNFIIVSSKLLPIGNQDFIAKIFDTFLE